VNGSSLDVEWEKQDDGGTEEGFVFGSKGVLDC